MIDTLYDCFKHWCQKGSIYIISDTHFDDKDCKNIDKNWVSAEEQVSIINKFVHKNDTLIHLGDVGNLDYIKKIKGYKVLIMGNHDTGITKFKEVFDEVYEGPLMISPKILLSHEPIEGLTWVLNIHGHDHNNIAIDDFHLNLATNICKYTPINLGKFLKRVGLKQIKDIHRQTIDKATKNKKKKSLFKRKKNNKQSQKKDIKLIDDSMDSISYEDFYLLRKTIQKKQYK